VAKRAKIPTELVALFESGVATWAASADGEGNPETVRVFGTRVRNSGSELTLYLPTASAGRTLANLDANPEVAVFFVAQGNYRALQVKGEVVGVRESRAPDRKFQETYRHQFITQVMSVGVPEALISRLECWPSTAVDVAVRELYVQTPGPGAGAPWR
jgi:hypothetical protein